MLIGRIIYEDASSLPNTLKTFAATDLPNACYVAALRSTTSLQLASFTNTIRCPDSQDQALCNLIDSSDIVTSAPIVSRTPTNYFTYPVNNVFAAMATKTLNGSAINLISFDSTM